MTDNISRYAVSPEKDFKRRKKLPPDKLVSFLISEGSSSTNAELLDFFRFNQDMATASALNQQRAKLKPEALRQAMYEFNQAVFEEDAHSKGLVGKFDYPASGSFDIDVNVTLVRSRSKQIHVDGGRYKRFADKNTAFDYIEYGSDDTYDISFRVVRIPLA